MANKAKLKKEQFEELISIIKKSPDPNESLKAFFIILLDRMPSKLVAEAVDLSPATLRRIKSQFIRQGVSGLKDERSMGGNRKIDPDIASQVLNELNQNNQGKRASFASIGRELRAVAKAPLDDSTIRRSLYRNNWKSAGRGYYVKSK